MSIHSNPYGGLISSSGPLAGANTMRFSSKPAILSATGAWGFYCYGYRFYDPGMQRWLNRDPLEEEGGLALYVFVTNDPIAFTDAFGEKGVARPGPGMSRQVNQYLRPNGVPIHQNQPSPPNPNHLWPQGRRPSICIRIPLISDRAVEGAEKGQEVARHLMGDPSQSCPQSPPPATPCSPGPGTFPSFQPSSGSYVNAPPSVGLYTSPPVPRKVFLRQSDGPYIVAPGTVVVGI